MHGLSCRPVRAAFATARADLRKTRVSSDRRGDMGGEEPYDARRPKQQDRPRSRPGHGHRIGRRDRKGASEIVQRAASAFS